MVVGPGDEAAGTGRYSSVRASHADRDRVIDLLKAAFVQGRLAKGEFDRRVGRVQVASEDPAFQQRPGRGGQQEENTGQREERREDHGEQRRQAGQPRGRRDCGPSSRSRPGKQPVRPPGSR